MAARTKDVAAAPQRPQAMRKDRIISWLVEFSRIDAAALARGRPGDLPNLIYELRQWLDLETDEPLNAEVDRLEKNPQRLQPVIDSVRELIEAVADRRRFQAA
jgi:hypothetical protein